FTLPMTGATISTVIIAINPAMSVGIRTRGSPTLLEAVEAEDGEFVITHQFQRRVRQRTARNEIGQCSRTDCAMDINFQPIPQRQNRSFRSLPHQAVRLSRLALYLSHGNHTAPGRAAIVDARR